MASNGSKDLFIFQRVSIRHSVLILAAKLLCSFCPSPSLSLLWVLVPAIPSLSVRVPLWSLLFVVGVVSSLIPPRFQSCLTADVALLHEFLLSAFVARSLDVLTPRLSWPYGHPT